MLNYDILHTVFTLLWLPTTILSTIVIVLASTGKSLGLRRFYTRVLLKIFEFGQWRIKQYEDTHRQIEEDDGECPEHHNHCTDYAVQEVIKRDISLSAVGGIKTAAHRPDYDMTDLKKDFHVSDIMYFAKCGAEAVIEDDVTKRFTAEELKTWNFLTRTTHGHQFISVRLTALWLLGGIFRYCLLLPFRFVILSIGLTYLFASTAIVGCLPDNEMKRKVNRYISMMAHRIFTRACSAVVTYHDRENMAKNGIVVANHTSPIDVIVLSCDNCYAMVGQIHSGFLGMAQRALARSTHHVWFERSEAKDRHLVAKRLKEHVADKNKLPILIFPEGTCINNTSVMMFKKGSFEVSSTVYPIAIKYDARFGDAFWNSSKMGMVSHIFEIMTSWALVVDVWYLPPMTRKENEDAVQFANRVKKEIARKGGLVDLEWDGQLKRMIAKDSWKSKPQEDFSKIIKSD